MLHALSSLNPVAVLVVAFVGFCFGAVWYSPLMFVKPWMEEMKLTPDSMKKNAGRFPVVMGGALAGTILSTLTLATLVAANHCQAPLKGAELGLFVGAGLVASRLGVNALFEGRTLRHYLVVAGHDVALCVIQGAVLAVWR